MPAAARYSNLHIVVCVAGRMQFSKRIRDGLDRRFFCIGPGGSVACAIKMVKVKNQGTHRKRKTLPTVVFGCRCTYYGKTLAIRP